MSCYLAIFDLIFPYLEPIILRKHPFLLALRRWGRFHETSPAAKSEEKRMFSQARNQLAPFLPKYSVVRILYPVRSPQSSFYTLSVFFTQSLFSSSHFIPSPYFILSSRSIVRSPQSVFYTDRLLKSLSHLVDQRNLHLNFCL